MKTSRKTLAAAVFALLTAITPNAVHATHGVGVARFNVHVEGNVFQIYGYDGDIQMEAFRLRDIAYILNGTPAQFAILRPPSDLWDFLIQLGEPHTPDGTELQPIPAERHALFGSLGIIPDSSYGFTWDWAREIVLGVGFDFTPVRTTSAVVFADIDDVYFHLSTLADMLGFEFERGWDWDAGVPVIEISMSNAGPMWRSLPIQEPELVRLLVRLSGQWVYRGYYYSPVIDESVVWPVEFRIGSNGFGFVQHPTGPMWAGSEPIQNFPVNKQVLDNGYIELTAVGQNLADIRIVIDQDSLQNDLPQQTLTYYIDGAPHEMVRFLSGEATVGAIFRRSFRYDAQACGGGGIRVSYLLPPHSLGTDLAELRIYRSAAPGEQGEAIIVQRPVAPRDRILFEFIDETAEHGSVYYYSLVGVFESPHFTHRQNLLPFFFLPEQQIRVDVNEVLGESPSPPTEDPPPINYAGNTGNPPPADYYGSAGENPPHQTQSRAWMAALAVPGVAALVYRIRKTALEGK